MPPPPTKRCDECSKDKKKCVMPDDESRCERCVLRGTICTGYDWPPVKNPPSGSVQKESNTPASEKYSRRNEAPSNNDQTYSPYSSAPNPGPRSSPGETRFTSIDSRYEVQLPYGVVAQQRAASVRHPGYNNTDAGLDAFTGNSMLQSTIWPNNQQYMSYQMGQGPGPGQGQAWYPPGQQNQKSTQYRRY